MRYITVSGARVHNLKDLNISIPRDSLVVFTGVSGSGKTSLAFDTIFAEGQRRYFETLSAYTRQFVADMERPDLDLIEGLSPAVSVSQKGMPTSPRSTVGTLTEIYDYLRLLYTAAGKAYCPNDGSEIKSVSPDRITDLLFASRPGAYVILMAPLVIGRKGVYIDLIEKIERKGFSRVRVDGAIHHVGDTIKMSRYKAHDIELVVDRVEVTEENRRRINESLVTCAREGEGAIVVHDRDRNEDTVYSTRMSCPKCGYGVPKLQPRMFSFNHPAGACPRCDGIGFVEDFDTELLIPDRGLSISEGAIAPLARAQNSFHYKLMVAAMDAFGIDPLQPIGTFDDDSYNLLMNGTAGKKYKIRYRSPVGRWKFATASFPGVLGILREMISKTESERVMKKMQDYLHTGPCPECGGMRLKKESLAVRVGGSSIGELSQMPVGNLTAFLEKMKLTARESEIGRGLLNEVLKRLGFLAEVGLSYLTLARPAQTLSGGEYQRVRLAAQIGTYLSGVTYVLDEPSVGLHPRDGLRLLNTLIKLRDLGNTVLVIEHDDQTIRRADHVVDIGPGAGRLGGTLVAQGKVKDIEKAKNSLTGQYLSGKLKVEMPGERRKPGKTAIRVRGAAGNNLKNIDVSIPLGLFVCLTGVSGSGKSTFAIDTLHPAVRMKLGLEHEAPLAFKDIKGVEELKRVLLVDTAPIGKTPRSTPATYIGVFDDIRKLFAMLPESRARGYNLGRFSYNVKGGRCEACQGNGNSRIEMHFLPDVFVTCPVCNGLRYNMETLEVTFKGKNIAEILNMTAEEALSIFENLPRISRQIEILRDIGLDYLLLGQPAPTLSTGEAQRIKLASELKAQKNSSTLYLLDEPTTGLHFSDIQKLLNIVNRLVDRGNTVVVIEHNIDVIKCADWIIDLGPEGGEEGGQIIAEGTPESIAKNKKS
ncbi:MAG: excinuclease ABC subunit UvrA, partial [bacterium]